MNGTWPVTDVEPDVPEEQPLPIRETFEAFYLREFSAMVALASAVTRNPAIGEDLAQEAMLRAHRQWRRVSTYDKPGAWVRRVTINLATSAVRRRATELRKLLRLGSAPPSPPTEPRDENIWRAVRRLPAKQRAAIALYYLEDRPVGEIAAVLNCAESTAKGHLHKGRSALAAQLGEGESP